MTEQEEEDLKQYIKGVEELLSEERKIFEYHLLKIQKQKEQINSINIYEKCFNSMWREIDNFNSLIKKICFKIKDIYDSQDNK